jgi:hypothetical protein
MHLSDMMSTTSMRSNATPKLYTEDKIDHDMSKIYEVF